MQAETPSSWETAVAELRVRPDAQELVKNCFYDDPLIDAAQRYWQSTEWRAVRLYLPERAGAALDVGAGRGISAYALARDGWKVAALEPDPGAIVGAGAIRALARDSSLAIEVTQTWGEELPFASNTFDLVHCRQVLHHARDLRQLCQQLGRVLKPGGRFVATREHVISRHDDLPVFLANHPLHRFYGGENAHLLVEYTDAIKAGGMRVDHVLNPMQSDINLFPATLASVKETWAKKLRLPSGRWIPGVALTLAGERSIVPGRLYSFIATKLTHV